MDCLLLRASHPSVGLPTIQQTTPADRASCPLTIWQRRAMRREYAGQKRDERVVRLLDYLELIETELVRVLQRAEEMEARLVRRPSTG